MKTSSSAARLAQHLRTLAEGQLPGSRLPSTRALMAELHVSPVTVQQAFDNLTREGVVEARPGQGTFVADRPELRQPAADLTWQSLALGPARATAGGLESLCLVPSADQTRALNAGYLPAELQPTGLLAASSSRALRRPGVWGRMPAEGLPALRAWFATSTAGAFQPHEVTICPGTQAANGAAFRALAAPGDPLLVESPTYVGALAAAQAAGLRVVPVPTDQGGVRPDHLADAFHRTGARVFYCQPTHANPTGAVLAPGRRAGVIAATVAAGAFLIEDDWARDFTLEGDPPPPLAPEDHDGHVIYVRSLTKCAAPGLRIGAICARGAALERLRAARLVDDLFVPGILQETALQLVSAPSWPRHLRSLCAALRTRRNGLADALRLQLGPDCLPNLPAGGLHLWCALPPGVSDIEVEQRAAARGILVSAGRHWYPAEPAGSFLRLSFAAAHPDWIGECIRELAGIVRAASTPPLRDPRA